jgi:aminoglycoside phosphotransferase (APT) family kinase protein
MIAPAAAVPGASDIDAGRLAAYLRDHIADYRGELALGRFSSGQSNPTYWLEAGGQRYVLRRKPAGQLLPSAHAIEREYRVMAALRVTEVPVPHMYVLCEDAAVIGTPFYVMEYVPGRVLFDPTLPEQSRAERAAMYDDLNRVLASLHQVDYRGIGLADYGKPGNYIARQLDRWSRQYRAAETERIDAMERLIEWLPAHIPAADETTLVHGDFRIDNCLFHPTEPRVVAVLDWELSTLGHPHVDFAYHTMVWRLGAGEFRGLADSDLPALGIPSETEYVAAYCRRRGLTQIADFDFYLAFNLFRLAAILQGIAARARQGNAASPDAVEQGQRARPIAQAGWRQVERMRKT